MLAKEISKKSTVKKETMAVLVPHTHWDREWYSPFQVFRTRLVKMMDGILAILAKDPKFTCFTMDGQVAPIEDYLEVRPEREKEIRKYVREGRIAIGPSYIQPDNSLISGEAHIRNLLLGMRLAEAFGKVMKVGYMPDAFGQIAQMPQILRGCGIDTAIFTRGVGDEGESLKSEFTWRAPDGMTSVLTHWLVLHYANLKDISTNMTSALAYVSRVVNMLKKKATTRNVLLMNGNDHVGAQLHIPLVVENVNKSNPDVCVKIGTFTDYFDLVKSGKPSLQVFEGEFRGSRYEAVLTGVTSTRTYIKQTNAETQTLLEKWAEPFDAWAWSLGEPHNHGLIWQAWKHTILCHPHDSICGCGIDPIHDEMMIRFASAQQLAGTVLKNDLCSITSKIKLETHDYAIVVFNPLSWTRTDSVETTVFVKKSTEEFEIIDPDGKSVPFGVISDRTIGRTYSTLYKEKVFDIVFLAENVPPCGYKAYRIRRLPREEVEGEGTKRGQSEMSPCEGDTIENEYLKVKVEENGSFKLTDKTTNTTYEDFNTLEDGGDVGDEYNYDPPREERIYSNKNSKAEITLIKDTRVRSTLRVKYQIQLPAHATQDRKTRSNQLIPCSVAYEVSLSPRVPRVDCSFVFENNAKDHRLRVLFPTGVRSDQAFADQAFHVIKRPTRMSQGDNWLEAPAPTHAMQSFVSLNDGDRGVTVATRGLMEYEVKQDGTIAVTLLRGVGMLSQEQLSSRPAAGPLIPTPGAQCIGERVFNYSVMPHKGAWEESEAYIQAMQHTVPMKTVQAVDHEFAVLKEQVVIPGEFNEPVARISVSDSPTLPLELSFLSVEPNNILVSAIKRAENGSGIIVRVYNTTNEKVEGKLRIRGNIRRVIPVDLREGPMNSGKEQRNVKRVNSHLAAFEARPFNIRTFLLVLSPTRPIKRKWR